MTLEVTHLPLDIIQSLPFTLTSSTLAITNWIGQSDRERISRRAEYWVVVCSDAWESPGQTGNWRLAGALTDSLSRQGEETTPSDGSYFTTFCLFNLNPDVFYPLQFCFILKYFPRSGIYITSRLHSIRDSPEIIFFEIHERCCPNRIVHGNHSVSRDLS